MTVFNDQATVQIGGQWNPNSNRVERPFHGVIAGVNFNGLRPLDLASEQDSRATLEGDVTLLSTIPFDYRDKHPQLFTKDAMKTMMDKAYYNRDDTLNPGSGKLKRDKCKGTVM